MEVLKQLRTGDYSLTVMELLLAVGRTDELFKQYEVNERKVSTIKKSIVATGVLLINPVVARYNSTYFVCSGRHRIMAVSQLFNSSTELYVDVVNVDSEQMLLELVLAYNATRTVTPAEKLHMSTQLDGLTTKDDTGDFVPVVSNIKSDRDLKSTTIAMFTEQCRPVPANAAKKAGTLLFKYIAGVDRVSSRKLTLDTTVLERVLEYVPRFVEEYDAYDGNKARAVDVIVERTINSLNLDTLHNTGVNVEPTTTDDYDIFDKPYQPEQPTNEPEPYCPEDLEF